jgi:hypothetical protein
MAYYTFQLEVIWPFYLIILMVGNWFANLIIDHSFGHNLCFKSLNVKYDLTFNI